MAAHKPVTTAFPIDWLLKGIAPKALLSWLIKNVAADFLIEQLIPIVRSFLSGSIKDKNSAKAQRAIKFAKALKTIVDGFLEDVGAASVKAKAVTRKR